MNKQHYRDGLRIGIGLILGAMANGAIADAYRNPAPTAEGIAKSGAVMIFSDDASAISYNPANLADQTNASFVASFAFAQSESTYTPPGGPEIVSDDPLFVLPNLYYSMPVTDRIVAGLGITTPYGQGVSWNSADFLPLVTVAPVIYDATMMVLNFNPSVGVKVTDSILLGAGLDVFYSQLELKALFPVPVIGILDTEVDSDGMGFGGNLGLTWLPTERQRVALTYRSRVDIDYEGDLTTSTPGVPASTFETTVKFPNIFGAGYGVQLSDDIQVEALLEWIQWSVNDIQYMTIDGVSSPVVNNWEDTITAAIGGSWQFAERWVLRTGYSYIETPIPDTTVSPSLPDTDRHIIGLGLGYTTGRHTVDISYSYTIYEDKTNPGPAVPGTYPGTYEIDSNLVGLTYSLSF